MNEKTSVSFPMKATARFKLHTMVLLIGGPLLLTILRPDWPYTNIFMPPWFDPFIYQSFFHHPGLSIAEHADYYPSTRLPWILFGAMFYHLFPPAAANFGLKFSVFVITSACIFATLRRLSQGGAAFLTLVLFMSYPYFIMSAGWDFVDSPTTLSLAAAYFGTALLTEGRSIKTAGLIIGFAFASAIICNLYAIVIGPSLFLFGIGSMLKGRTEGRKTFLVVLVAILLGVVACFLVFSVASWSLGGSFDLLGSQLRQAIGLTFDKTGPNAGFRGDGWNKYIPNATWLAMPTSVAVFASICGLKAVLSLRNSETRRDDLFVILSCIHFVSLYALFWLINSSSMAVLALWFYSGFLNASTFITLGVLLHYLSRMTSRRSWEALVYITLAVLLVPFYPAIGLTFQRSLGMSFGGVSLVFACCLTTAALSILIAGIRFRSIALSVLGSAVMGIGYVSMTNQYQLSDLYVGNRKAGFNAVETAVRDIDSISKSANRYVWVERQDPEFGSSLFHAIWIRSLMTSKDWGVGFDGSTSFPAVPARGFEVDQPVAILTKRADWMDQAQAALNAVHLRLSVDKVDHIRKDSVSFDVILGRIVSD